MLGGWVVRGGSGRTPVAAGYRAGSGKTVIALTRTALLPEPPATMPRLSLAKLERHLYAAADRLRQEGLDAAIYKDYIFGLLFLKRCSDVFEAERERIVGKKIEQGGVREHVEERRDDMAINAHRFLRFSATPASQPR
jgi:hypothetical protein